MKWAHGAFDSDTEQHLDLAEVALDQGDPESALAFCEEVLKKAPDHPGALFIAGEAYRFMRVLPEAEYNYRRTTQLVNDHSPSWSSLAAVLFDQLRFDEARRAVLTSIRTDPFNAEAYFVRGLLRERTGDDPGASRDFRRAWRLAPELYHLPVELDDETIGRVIDQAIEELPASVRVYLNNVAILLEDFPDADVCRLYDPPAPPAELLGHFSGVPESERDFMDPWANMPTTIRLFRRNLQRFAPDREQLLEELRVTVFHEVLHQLGLDEQDMEDRGLD